MKYPAINGWTKQGILDVIERDFVGFSSDKQGDVCAYRGHNGTKCPVGLFIPDEKYLPSMEPLPVNALIVDFPFVKTILPLPGAALSRLQTIHDCNGHMRTPDLKWELLSWVETYVEDDVK